MAAQAPPRQRWRTSRMVEDYCGMVSDLMLPEVTFADYGNKPADAEFPVERPTLLGNLLNPLRQTTALEEWSPREIAVFEGAISLHGKSSRDPPPRPLNFHTIQRFVKTKTTKEVIEFYYLWKMSSHYTEWKRNFEPEMSEY